VLYIVLALVLAAFGLLIAALTTANTLWAWISVVVSVVAATLLIMDWISGRREKARAGEPVRPRAVTVGGSRHPREEPLHDEYLEDEDFPLDPLSEPMSNLTSGSSGSSSNLDFEPPVKLELPLGPTEVRTVVTEPVAAPPPAEPPDEEQTSIAAQADFAGEPGEEPTDASDLLVVAGLSVEVRVVDEHPRYHLATCVWLANRPTIPVPVSEARQLGFTPCARCGPDATLAARHRARAK
jgi:hypothetical protein